MEKVPIPANEAERLESLYALKILDTPTEERFDRITRITTQFFRVPISTITLVDSDREWFKSCHGLDAREGERAISFCGHAIVADGVFVVPDASKDPRFADNPMVIDAPYIRFYAAYQIFSADGAAVGALCIKDLKPRVLSEDEQRALRDLAAWAELELNAHELSTSLEARRVVEAKLQQQNDELQRFNNIMVNRELKMIELKKEIAQLKKSANDTQVSQG